MLKGIDYERLDELIRLPGELSGFLKTKGKVYKIIPPACFFLWEIEGEPAEEGKTEHMMMITDIPVTLDPETYIPTKVMPRNGFSSDRNLSEMILKSVYVSDVGELTALPFT